MLYSVRTKHGHVYICAGIYFTGDRTNYDLTEQQLAEIKADKSELLLVESAVVDPPPAPAPEAPPMSAVQGLDLGKFIAEANAIVAAKDAEIEALKAEAASFKTRIDEMSKRHGDALAELQLAHEDETHKIVAAHADELAKAMAKGKPAAPPPAASSAPASPPAPAG